MRTRIRPLMLTTGKNLGKEVFAVQVYARGKWCWLTNGFKIIKHKTREAAEREREEMRRRPAPSPAG